MKYSIGQTVSFYMSISEMNYSRWFVKMCQEQCSGIITEVLTEFYYTGNRYTVKIIGPPIQASKTMLLNDISVNEENIMPLSIYEEI